MGADEIEDVSQDEIDAACEDMAGVTDPADEMAEFLTLQSNDRLWLRAAIPLVQAATKVDPATHERVKHAINDMAIAACERAARIFRSDLPPVGYEDSDDPEDA